MKKQVKFLALILALLLLMACVGCGDSGSAATPSGGSTASTAPTSGAVASVAPSADGAGTPEQTSLEKLLAMADQTPLGGVQPAVQESRADIYKALDKPADKNGDGVITIGWENTSENASFFVAQKKHVEDECAKYGYELKWASCEMDLNVQMTQIENLLTQGIDYLCINNVNIPALKTYFDQSVDLGIPVFVVGPNTGDPSYSYVVNYVTNPFNLGFDLGVYCCDKLYEQYKDTPLKIGSIVNNINDTDSNSKINGFISGYMYEYDTLSGTKQYGNKWDATLDAYDAWTTCRDKGSSVTKNGEIELVGAVSAGATDDVAGQAAAGDLLTAHMDMNLLFVEAATMQTGVMNEVALHGLTVGKDLQMVFGSNGEMYCVKAIMDGTVLACGVNPPYYTSGGIIDLIHKIIEEGYDANNMPGTAYTPTAICTGDNAKDYYDPDLLFPVGPTMEYQTIDEFNAEHAGE